MIEIHHKNPHPPIPNQPWLPSVHGVILDEQGSILLHKREDHPLWALPGGKLEPGESLVSCLKREVQEETGLEVSAEKLVGIFSSSEYLLSVHNAVYQPLLIVFLCRIKQGRLKLTPESISFTWLRPENIKDIEAFPLIKEIAQWVWDKKEEAFFDSSCFENKAEQ